MVLGLLTYANAVNHPFVHDDVAFIQNNPYLGDLDLKNFFRQTSSPYQDLRFVNQYYRPILELTNRILYRIVGINPSAFHFFNILLHIINSFLVYNVIVIVTDNRKKLSIASAILFLLHPIQSEAVACISGISNLLFVFLCLISFYLYLTTTCMKEKGKRGKRHAIALILFFLALLAKEQSVVLPFLIVAYELCFTEKLFKVFSRRCWYVVGYFIVLVGYFLLRKALFGFAVTATLAGPQEYLMILLAIPRSILIYLNLLLFPYQLHYYRSQDILLPFTGPILLLLGVAILAILLIVRIPSPQKKWMVFGLSWFGIALLPALNIFPLINEYSLILTSEHFLYFPIIGVFLFVMGVLFDGFKKIKEDKIFLIGFIICGLVSMIYMSMTVKQNSYWRSEIPLFERTLKFEKNFGRVRFLLAKAYANEGRFQEAVEEDFKALAIMQGYVQKVKSSQIEEFYLNYIKEIHFHLGSCFVVLGNWESSLDHYKKALDLEPDSEIIYYAVGLAYINTHNIPKAITHFEKVIGSNENNLMAMNSLALCYQETGELAKAEKYLRIIVEKDSQSVSARQNLENFLQKYK
jgi:tetratricopeptide (TPR) repeat protein